MTASESASSSVSSTASRTPGRRLEYRGVRFENDWSLRGCFGEELFQRRGRCAFGGGGGQAKLIDQLVEIENLFDRSLRAGGLLQWPGRHGLRDALDGVFEVGVVLGQLECALVVLQRFRHLPAALENLRQSADRREVIGNAGDDDVQLRFRRVQFSEFGEGAAEGDTGREITGVAGEAGAADGDGFLVGAHPPAFLRELRKSNRRRVCLDPASKFEHARTVGHWPTVYGLIVTCTVTRTGAPGAVGHCQYRGHDLRRGPWLGWPTCVDVSLDRRG